MKLISKFVLAGIIINLFTATTFSAVLTSQINPDTSSIFDTSHLTGDQVVAVEEEVIFQDIEGHWAKSYIEQLYLGGVVNGKSENNFDPNGYITRAELTKIALLGYEYSPNLDVTETPFVDVFPGDWFAGYVVLAKEKNIINGYGLLFKPNAFITRAEALKVLAESAGFDPSLARGLITFTDVKSSDWFYNYVRIATELGVVNGYEDNTYRPNAFITRAEASKILSMFMLAK